MLFRQLYDPHLAQYAYLVGCQETGEALVIDPERDVDRYVRAAEEEGLTLTAAAETHIHADFLSGARELAAHHGTKLYLSAEGGDEWQVEWAKASAYDVTFLRDGDTFRVGNVELRAVHTPGHTPEHLSFLVTDRKNADAPMGLASGDFVFVGDLGRPDLLESAAGHAQQAEPSARQLYASVHKLEDLPDFLQVWPGHGAGSACGKALGAVPQTTLGYERRTNPAIRTATAEGERAFVRDILADQPEPPLYFGRMKRENREGPKLLGALPHPEEVPPSALDDLAGGGPVTVVDTRPPMTYMNGHLPGSILAPFDSTFATVVGSYVLPDEPVVLVIEEEHVEDAVRALVRIGLDAVRGYVTPRTLEAWGEGDRLSMLKAIDFDELDGRRHYTNVEVLDVRRQDEFAENHVPGARHVPHVRLREHLDALPRDKTILVHCASGVRSAVAAALLHARGFSVAYVADRFANWKERDKEEGVTAGAH
ncbi:MAG: rhodanese-like domain-containing protein [Rhodothermales bacterium]|nr:rhodanese-like domain-containing protein [Rhodothermales bacterium]